ncbi:hypothetical protein VTL71DRAFT_13193 [Oculimacula yallundae]|uniref:Uncharacterized protein n=1 Tax=Oculimacula yallundae TaxID=86028 RepID=A0ABR4CKA4_9HELO
MLRPPVPITIILFPRETFVPSYPDPHIFILQHAVSLPSLVCLNVVASTDCLVSRRMLYSIWRAVDCILERSKWLAILPLRASVADPT